MKRYMLGGMTIGAVLACAGACWVVSANSGAWGTQDSRVDVLCVTFFGAAVGLFIGWLARGTAEAWPNE